MMCWTSRGQTSFSHARYLRVGFLYINARNIGLVNCCGCLNDVSLRYRVPRWACFHIRATRKGRVRIINERGRFGSTDVRELNDVSSRDRHSRVLHQQYRVPGQACFHMRATGKGRVFVYQR